MNIEELKMRVQGVLSVQRHMREKMKSKEMQAYIDGEINAWKTMQKWLDKGDDTED